MNRRNSNDTLAVEDIFKEVNKKKGRRGSRRGSSNPDQSQ